MPGAPASRGARWSLGYPGSAAELWLRLLSPPPPPPAPGPTLIFSPWGLSWMTDSPSLTLTLNLQALPPTLTCF